MVAPLRARARQMGAPQSERVRAVSWSPAGSNSTARPAPQPTPAAHRRPDGFRAGQQTPLSHRLDHRAAGHVTPGWPPAHRGARFTRLRETVPVTNAIVGIGLAACRHTRVAHISAPTRLDSPDEPHPSGWESPSAVRQGHSLVTELSPCRRSPRVPGPGPARA